MDTTITTAYNNSLNLYNNNNRCIQQPTQAPYQQQYLVLNQGQFYGSSSHLNHQSESMWEKQHQHQQQQQQQQQKSSYIVPNEEYQDKPQHFHSNYNPYYPTNITRNIKTEYESPLFMGSAEEHSKVTTNNKYRNSASHKNKSSLSLIKEDFNKPSIVADVEDFYDEDNGEEEENQGDNHAKKR